MIKIKVEGMPSIAGNVWHHHKNLIGACRLERKRGFKDGDPSYEAKLDKMKSHAFAHNLLLGNIHAIENGYAREYP